MAKITYTPVKLPAYARKNLLQLADGLIGQRPPPKFDMNSYLDFDDIYAARRLLKIDNYTDIDTEVELTPFLYTAPECGTTACAAGHGPFYGIKKKKGEGWDRYIDRVFLPGYLTRPSIDMMQEVWAWLFSWSWANYDNTAKGAAKRIYTLLDKGLPDNAKEQMLGDVPRSYTRQQRPA